MRRYRGFMLLVVVGLAAALVVLVGRWNVERSSRTVGVIIDGPVWRDMAVREGRDPQEFLTAVRAAGATSIAMYESTLKDLQEQGRATYLSGGEMLARVRLGTMASPFQEFVAARRVRTEAVYVQADGPIKDWVDTSFRGILGEGRVRRVDGLLEVLGTLADLEELGLGFYPPDVAAAAESGFSVVLRPRNYRGLTAEGLAWKLEAMRRLERPSVVVFEGADVLGFERLIDEAAAGLRAIGYRYGRVEAFTARRKQRGEDALTARMRPAVIRLFSLTPEEMATTALPAVVDKFVRAAQERNIRLLYVRPLTQTPAGIDAIEANLTLVRQIIGGLRRHGFAVGRPEPLPDASPSRVLLLLTAAGGLALGAITLAELLRAAGFALRPSFLWALVVAGVAATAAAAWGGEGVFLFWRQVLALGIAVAGGTVAVAAPLTRTGGRALFRGLSSLWIGAGLAAAAGVLVGALLTGWPFMMAVRTFVGVKVAQVLPPVLVGFLLAFGGRAGDVRSTLRQIWQWLERPLRLQYAVVAVLVAVVAVMLLVRSGNFGLPVLGPEVRLREILEDLLVARPRTKEFLIGHPALVLAAAAAALGLRAAVIPLAMVGAVGQAGIINSFSHIHTPLVLVILRTFYALVIGSVLGGLAVLVLAPLVRRFGPAPAPLRRRVGARVPSPAADD